MYFERRTARRDYQNYLIFRPINFIVQTALQFEVIRSAPGGKSLGAGRERVFQSRRAQGIRSTVPRVFSCTRTAPRKKIANVNNQP